MKKITRDLELEEQIMGMIRSSEREMTRLGWMLADSYLDCYKKYKGMARDIRARYNLPSTGKLTMYAPDYAGRLTLISHLQMLKKIAKHNERERRHHGGHEVSYYGVKRQGDGRDDNEKVCDADELG